jgi:hypothetical protein
MPVVLDIYSYTRIVHVSEARSRLHLSNGSSGVGFFTPFKLDGGTGSSKETSCILNIQKTMDNIEHNICILIRLFLQTC